MPFKSQAQRRFFYAAEARGDLPKGTARRWQKETGKKKLPERLKKTAAWIRGLAIGMARAMKTEPGYEDDHGSNGSQDRV